MNQSCPDATQSCFFFSVYQRDSETETDEYEEHNYFCVTQKYKDVETLVQAIFDVAVDNASVVKVSGEVEEECKDRDYEEEHKNP